MRVYVYYDTFQESYLKQLMSRNKKWLPIKSMDLIKETSDFLLVLIAQPSQSALERMNTLSFKAIFVRYGIRQSIKGAYLFDSEEALYTEMGRFQKQYEEGLKQAYETHLLKASALSTEDINYLKQLKGAVEPEAFEETHVKTLNRVGGLIVVSGSPQFAVALSKGIAKHLKLRTLIVDGNLLKPSLERHFNIQNIYTKVESHLKGIDNTGFNIALDAIGKRASLAASIKAMTHKQNNRLEVLLGNYNLYNYEHYDEKMMEALLDELTRLFDVVVLSVDTLPYDALTLLGLHVSTQNFIVTDELSETLRYSKNLIELLETKQRLPRAKIKVICQGKKRSGAFLTASVMKSLYGDLYSGTFYGPEASKKEIEMYMGLRKKRWG